MASLCRGATFQMFKRPLYTSARLANFINPVDLATGPEKQELLAKIAGHDDPFDVKVKKLGPGTYDCPNLIGSAFKSRIVGCICNKDQLHINWMWIHEGAPRRCECGYWFKLVECQPVDH